MITQAVDALLGLLANVPQSDQEWKAKADIIRNFAEEMSEQILLRTGFTEDQFEDRELAHVLDDKPDEANFPNQLSSGTLVLVDVRSDLSLNEDSSLGHEFIFCQGRVVEWNSKKKRPHRILSYEETARFVVFWFAEKLIQIIRKNQWDHIKQLPDLFDRLATFFMGAPTQYKLESLLIEIGGVGIGGRVRNTLVLNEGLHYVGDVVQKTARELLRVKNFGKKSLRELEDFLKPLGLSLGMSLSPQEFAWYQARRQPRS